MKSLKLTELARLQKEEMNQIQGGRDWFVKFKSGEGGGCLCVGSCTDDGERADTAPIKQIAPQNGHFWASENS